jgi:hypothetical protein
MMAEQNTNLKEALRANLTAALPLLQSAFETAQAANLGETNYDFYMSICDAYNDCNEALERVDDEPSV